MLNSKESAFWYVNWNTFVMASKDNDDWGETIDPWYNPEGEPDPDIFPEENAEWHEKRRRRGVSHLNSKQAFNPWQMK